MSCYSLNGLSARGRYAVSAVCKALIICSFVCWVKVLITSPVAEFTLRYGTVWLLWLLLLTTA